MFANYNMFQGCLNLVNNEGYQIIQTNGQRSCRRLNDKRKPQKGSKIFVGKLPRDLYEDEIIPLFGKIGPVHQIRLMMDFDGRNRGFCFIVYYLPAHANLAVSILNGFEIRPTKRIGVYKSLDNCRLFVAGIPLDKTRGEVRENFARYVEGIVDVIMYPSRENRNQNRGYAFVEFESHRCAAMARRNLSPGSLVLWDVPILVDWADPLPEVDPVLMSQIKKLYVRNLDPNLTAQDINNFLIQFVSSSSIAKIHKSHDYAFIHFTTRMTAEYCYNILKGKKLHNLEVDVMWAWPKMYSKSQRASQPLDHFCSSLPQKLRKQVILNKMSNNKPPFGNISSSSYSDFDISFWCPNTTVQL